MNMPKEYFRRRREKLKHAGRCVDCGRGEAVTSHVLCTNCLKARSVREEKRQLRLAQQEWAKRRA